MEFNINGTLYLLKNTKLNFENDKYESKEYKLLKKWLIFSKNPKSLKEIQKLEIKIDLMLKEKINGYTYNQIKNRELKEESTQSEFNIPDIYIRYLDILNNIIEI
jgi:hypothetical protein